MLASNRQNIHWLGAGLSSVPGIRYLAQQGHPMMVWNRTIAKAEAALKDVSNSLATTHAYSETALAKAIQADDIVVSMLPAAKHLDIAKLCLQNGAHLLTASYLSPEMVALDKVAKEKNLCFVNEIGLDPGLDHILAYEAVEAFQKTPHWNDPQARVKFRSLCGGLSEIPNEFRYRFSWSPIGVLKALKNPAAFIEEGTKQETSKVWERTTQVAIETEIFEAYPNRDSLPYISEYELADGAFQLQTFIRGSLRLAGWSKAWKPIFDQIENANDEALSTLSEQLWVDHALENNANDRVILFVRLESESPSHGKWIHQGLVDHLGNESGSAMGKLVSLPLARSTVFIREGKTAKGVTSAPKSPYERNRILCGLAGEGIKLNQKTSWTNA